MPRHEELYDLYPDAGAALDEAARRGRDAWVSPAIGPAGAEQAVAPGSLGGGRSHRDVRSLWGVRPARSGVLPAAAGRARVAGGERWPTWATAWTMTCCRPLPRACSRCICAAALGASSRRPRPEAARRRRLRAEPGRGSRSDPRVRLIRAALRCLARRRSAPLARTGWVSAPDLARPLTVSTIPLTQSMVLREWWPNAARSVALGARALAPRATDRLLGVRPE